MLCKQCGAQVSDGSLFCTNCGAKLEAEQAQPEIQPAAAQEPESVNQETAPLVQNDDTDVTDNEPVVSESEPVVQPQPAPVNQEPVYQEPQPVYQQPQYQQPVYQQPQYEQPQYQQPVYRQPQYQQPVYQQPQQQTVPGFEPPYNVPHHGYVGFGEAIRLFFINYVNFRNRASKSEFWWGFLFASLCSMLCWIPYLGWIIMVGIMLPSLSLTVRRLHDIGKPWTTIFLGLIPIAGAIILLVYAFRPSEGDNPWGPGPYNNQAAYTQPPVYPQNNYPNQ